jgi:hypothetical protein
VDVEAKGVEKGVSAVGKEHHGHIHGRRARVQEGEGRREHLYECSCGIFNSVMQSVARDESS